MHFTIFSDTFKLFSWNQSDQIVANPTLKVAFCYALKTTPCFLKTAFLLPLQVYYIHTIGWTAYYPTSVQCNTTTCLLHESNHFRKHLAGRYFIALCPMKLSHQCGNVTDRRGISWQGYFFIKFPRGGGIWDFGPFRQILDLLTKLLTFQ